jgi:phage terminase large subunit-like protein
VTLTLPTAGSTECLPRFATPRNYEVPTLGAEVGEVARRLGTPLMPWQQYAADVIYEYDPDSGAFFYDEADVGVPRQSGKTTLVKAKTTHRMTVMAKRLGPQRSTYTAQTRLAARKKLERDFAPSLRTSRSFREVPHARARPTTPTEWRLSLNNGSELIEFGTGSYWQIDAPSRTGGHGDTLDDGTIDEAFAHEDDTVEGSMRPAQATRTNAQLWVISTAGDSRSKYWYRKIVAGRAAHESGVHGRTAFFEWSAPDDADPGDPEVWITCSPALGHTISVDFIRGEWDRAQRKGQEGIDTFRRAYLNQWPEIPILDEATYQVVAGMAWAACADRAHVPSGKLSFALDVDTNTKGEEWCSIGASDGFHLEVVTPLDVGPGLEWVVPAVVAKKHLFTEILIDPSGPAVKLISDLESAGVTVRRVKPDEMVQASGQLVDKATTGGLVHIDQPVLNRAVAGAARRDVGDGAWKLSRSKSSVDISPLIAVTLARFAAQAPASVADFFTI